MIRNISLRVPLRKLKLLAALSALLSIAGQAQSQVPTPYALAAPATSLTLLSYNVHGLPWPLTSGRPAAFAQIAERLRDMRRTGTQPAVVALQEAFTTSAKQIGEAAGYRYIVKGPSAADRSAIAMTATDRKFASGASWLNGETLGPVEDSGLEIMSDYPILSVRSAVFPRFACAGYDCLANKGVLLVTVKIPGQALPVEIATAHMNSRGASGVGDDRTGYAYQRQVDALAAFFRANSNPALPLIFAGDFNIGKALSRQVALRSRAGNWWGTPDPTLARGALRVCMEGVVKKVTDRTDAQTALRRAKDWQFPVNTPRLALVPSHVFVPFGTEADGTMLSDHIGYSVRYDFRRRV
ncbi:MAG: endonuclease/exonuclease/phosphatase [Sphingomonadales bacterium]|nr:endonuclease/exonuclease/phosphatase [Sphingomonadales bacterium]